MDILYIILNEMWTIGIVLLGYSVAYYGLKVRDE